MKILRTWRWRMAIAATVAVASWLTLSFLVAYLYTHRAAPIAQEKIPSLPWGRVEPLRLVTVDGENLGAWFIEGRSEQPVVILLHGNGACRSLALAPAELVVRAGCAVLTVTLRAHGDSTGDVNDFGYSARHDVAAAVGWVEKNLPGRRILVFGQSLGAAAAIFAASELGTRVSGYILESPFQNLRTAVWHRLQARLPCVLDAVVYAGLSLVAPLTIPELDQVSPITAIDGIPASIPVLIIAGSKDRRVPIEESRAIAQRIADHSHLVVIDGDHLALEDADPPTYRAAVLDFITMQ